MTEQHTEPTYNYSINIEGIGQILGNAAQQIARAGFEIASAIREAAQLYAADRGLTYPEPRRSVDHFVIGYTPVVKK